MSAKVTLNYRGYWLKHTLVDGRWRWQVWDGLQQRLLATCDTEQGAKELVQIDRAKPKDQRILGKEMP